MRIDACDPLQTFASARRNASTDVPNELSGHRAQCCCLIEIDNDHFGARAIWEPLQQLVPRLFQEANPMPIKHCLWRQGLIASAECRLPLSSVSVDLGGILDRLLGDLAMIPGST